MSKKVSKAEQAARERERQLAGRSQGGRRSGRNRSLTVVCVALALLAVAIALVYFSSNGSASGPQTAVGANLGPLTAARPSGSHGNFQRVSAPYRQGKKPVLLFVGAQYCPFCGAERWAVVKALSRFGTWADLKQGHSTGGEGGFGVVPTYDLLHTQYRSRYVVFEHKDVADGAGNQLQPLSSTEQSLFNRYDSSGSIPLVYVDGYAMSGSDYSPAELQGDAFAAVARQLQRNGSASYVRDINGEANLLTAFLCQADGGKPGAVCKNTTIRVIETALH